MSTPDRRQSAHNPDVFKVRGTTRPLSNKEALQRTAAVCKTTGDPRTPSCSGQIFVGLFFDGTGNNEENDFFTPKVRVDGQLKQGSLADRKQSNVVRLYHAFPNRGRKGTTSNYKYYIPGVGTPFPKIGDEGGTKGSAMAWYGEPRVVWGLIQILNAINDFIFRDNLIPDEEAKEIANSFGGLVGNLKSLVGDTNEERRAALKAKLAKLKDKIGSREQELKAKLKGQLPRIEQVNLSVFGFSRGAAEARACVNWLFEICEQKDGAWQVAGVPLRVQFMGLLDTVASVGMAGMYSIFEGRQAWAWNNMQVHPGVEQCLHFVAAHEVRACFPSDSVREGEKYPANTKEYVYPGAHSDVGGGYHPKSQGKRVDMARVPGFDMYLAAMEAGVPFVAYDDLTEEVSRALRPTDATVEVLRQYMKSAGIRPAPVEEMARQHMSWYFSYRWQMTQTAYQQQSFFARAKQNTMFPNDASSLLDTQQALMNVLAGIKADVDKRVDDGWFANGADALVDSPYAFSSAATYLTGPVVVLGLDGKRRMDAQNDANQAGIDSQAADVVNAVKRWRNWMSARMLGIEVHNENAPERDMLNLVDSLHPEPIPQETRDFFNDYIHDSMAGFASAESVDEFLLNGFGIAKLRRIYAGNEGDALFRERVAAQNKQDIAAAKKMRAQRAQWDAESREFQRTQPTWNR